MAPTAAPNSDRRRSKQWERMQQLGWVTRKEAAARARRDPRTILRWAQDGTATKKPTLDSKRIGKAWYISTQSLQKLLGALADLAPGSPGRP